MKLTRFKAPDTTLIIFSIIVLAAAMTWLLPAGAYDKTELMVEGAGMREVVVPGSYHTVARAFDGVGDRLLHTVAIILQAPVLGFIDEDAAPIIVFVLLVGGAFAVLQQTGAVDDLASAARPSVTRSRAVEVLTIPLFMVLFSLGGADFGMAEETIPFILIFVPLALALGYDSVTGWRSRSSARRRASLGRSSTRSPSAWRRGSRRSRSSRAAASASGSGSRRRS